MNKIVIVFISLFFLTTQADAQHEEKDTFFLAKKKGVLGKLGKSISTTPVTVPVKTVNPYKKFLGKSIRTIEISPLSFNENIYDTNLVRNNLAIRVANFFHKNTHIQVVRNNLFFREGDKFLPLLVADNERYLRDLTFLQDARIVVFGSSESPDSVDILVLTKDVFSIGGKFSASSTNKFRGEIREDNIHGSGNAFAIRGLYDRERNPLYGIGAEFIKRNMRGSFFDWTTGFETFSNAYNTARREELTFYTRVEKPFVSRYAQWTGALDLSFNTSKNVYSDALFKQFQQYSNHQIDLWAGYNIGYKKARKTDSENRLRHFVAARSFYTKFTRIPVAFKDSFSNTYADINGGLLSYSLYRQNFYRTNFIYGFGRNEDVPIGLSATAIGGWTNKENRRRLYYGLDFEGNLFSQRGYFTSFKLKAGAFSYKSVLEDISLLVGADHFTRLRRMGSHWLNRNFVNISYTRLFNTELSEPLILQSIYGLPYFRNGSITADARTTVKLESVFFNTQKVLGFRFAPFAFTEFSLLNPVGAPVNKSNGYTSIGGGIRTRNENLIFGTIELKGYYFPRTVADMKGFRVDLSTKLRFKFNSSFVKRPEFVVAN